MMAVMIEEIRSCEKTGAAPALSVLIPYYKDDPVAGLHALAAQFTPDLPVEVLLYDDGTADDALNARVIDAVRTASIPVTLLIASQNRGRAFARNQLTQRARAKWVLFLDADMRPERSDFLARYIDRISQDKDDIIFGGFTVDPAAADPDREVHRLLSLSSDCLSAAQRSAHGAQYVATSNLCVRKSVLQAEPFDPAFSGWGWEDSEWAARAARRYRLSHLENPARHLGLETTDSLLSRFKTSGPNYRRFTDLHPELAQTLSLYKWTRRLRRIPGQALSRPVLAALVKAARAPMRARLWALKLWRASWYAESF